MNEQIPQTEKKGLSKGCTVALIIGGIVFVIIVACLILLFAKGKDVAKWAFIKAVDNEKVIIMSKNISGIDTVAVNKVAAGFKDKIESPKFAFDQVSAFQTFVQKYATDMKADSTEASAFVEAMVQCYPELADLYQPSVNFETSKAIDSSTTKNQSP